MFTSHLMIDLLMFFASLLALIYFYFTRNHNYWKIRGIAYVKPTIWGSFPEVLTLKKSIGIAYRDLHLKMDCPYMGIYILHKPHLLVKEPDLIKSILIEGFSHFQERNLVTKSKHDTLASHMLPFMGRQDWGIYRKKITPVHTSSKIKLMYPFFKETSDSLVDYLFRKSEETDILDFKDVAGRYSTEIITSTAFGVKANTFTEENSQFFKINKSILNFNKLSRAIAFGCYMFLPYFVDLFRIVLVDPESASFLRYVFWQTMTEREKTQTVRNDLIDVLLQMKNAENEKFDGDKVLAQAVTFLLGGFETTSSSIAFVLYEIAKHTEVQNKLRKELKEIDEIHEALTYDHFHDGSLKYLDMVVKETLRKYPALPFLDRKCNKKFTIPGTDTVIEEGVGVYVSTMGLHMDPENFPDPEAFNPDRFSAENVDKIKPYTYMPFGDGPRSCTGNRFGTLSIKNAVSSILLNFEVEFCEDTPEKIEFHRHATTLTPLSDTLPLRYKVLKGT